MLGNIKQDILFPERTREQTYPWDMDSLEIDIDSYDCELMETMLSLSSPKVVAVEFNPLFPPKVAYMQKYKEGTCVIIL